MSIKYHKLKIVVCSVALWMTYRTVALWMTYRTVALWNDVQNGGSVG